jgi:acetylglutamate kinase
VKRLSVLKLGGELIENDQRLKAMGRAIKSAAKLGRLVIVHGGGREIDAALAQVGIPKRQVDGLRVTDPETLNIVVSVLAGTINTKFVAAINAAGGKAVGLTGADAGVAPVEKAAPAQGDERRDDRPGHGRHADQGAVARRDRDALPRRIHPGRRLRRRVEERKVVQRQRRYAGGQSGGAAEGQAPG